MLNTCALQDQRRESFGVEKSTSYWMNYGESKIFKILHEV
jgi:hypothetical protein